MKKYWRIALLFLCVAATASCNKDDDEIVVDEVWKLANDEAFQEIASDPAYSEIKSFSNNGSIYVKELKQGTGVTPYYTDSVTVYYTGRYYDGEEFDSAQPPFQSPVLFTPDISNSKRSVIEGFGLALQNMQVGDKWEVWIPQQLGYGPNGNLASGGTMKGYTTLHYEIELVSVISAGIEYTEGMKRE